MFCTENNEKNKSAVILSPERSEWVSRSHVTSVEIVVNDGAKTKPHHALRRSLRALAYGSPLKMTATASCREAHKRRFIFNLKIPGIFRLTAKNRDDSFYFGFAEPLVL